MPKLPTQNEPGSVPIQTSGVNTEAFTQEALSKKQALGSISGSLLGRASGTRAQSESISLQSIITKSQEKKRLEKEKEEKILKQIANKELINKRSKELSKLVDLKRAYHDFKNGLFENAQKTGEDINIDQAISKFEEIYNENSKDLDDEGKLFLQQQSMKLIEDLYEGADKVAASIDLLEVQMADDKTTKDALSHIQRADRVPTPDDLKTAIKVKKDYLKQQGFEGIVLEDLMKDYTENFTGKYFEYQYNLVKGSLNAQQDVQIEDRGFLMVDKLKGLAAAVVKNDDLTQEQKEKLLKDIGKDYQTVQKDFQTYFKEQEQARILNKQYLSGELKATSQEAKDLSDKYFSYAASDIGLNLTETGQVAVGTNPKQITKAVERYFQNSKVMPRLPETLGNQLKSALHSSPEAREWSTLVYAELKNHPRAKHMLKDFVGAENASLFNLLIDSPASYGTGSPEQFYNSQQKLAENPEAASAFSLEGSQVFADKYQEIAKAVTGNFFADSALRLEDWEHDFKKDFVKFYKHAAILNKGRSDLSYETAIEMMRSDWKVITDIKSDWFNNDETIVYMKQGQIGDDFEEQIFKKIENTLKEDHEDYLKRVEKGKQKGLMADQIRPSFMGRLGIEDATIYEDIPKVFRLIPTKNAGEQTPNVARFNVQTDNGITLTDELGRDIQISYEYDPEKSNAASLLGAAKTKSKRTQLDYDLKKRKLKVTEEVADFLGMKNTLEKVVK